MPTNSSLVAYLVIIFIQLSNAFSYEENQKSKSTDSKMSEYPPMHQTYCPQANIQQLTDDLSSNLGTISVEGIIMKNKCHEFFKMSHKCSHLTPEIRKHRKIRAKIGGISYSWVTKKDTNGKKVKKWKKWNKMEKQINMHC